MQEGESWEEVCESLSEVELGKLLRDLYFVAVPMSDKKILPIRPLIYCTVPIYLHLIQNSNISMYKMLALLSYL